MKVKISKSSRKASKAIKNVMNGKLAGVGVHF